MTEDEFRSLVISRFDAMGSRMDALFHRLDDHDARLDRIEARIEAGFHAADKRMDALFVRINVQDEIADDLSGKLDRVSVYVRTAMESSEHAISTLIQQSRRISRLENPEGYRKGRPRPRRRLRPCPGGLHPPYAPRAP